MAEFPLEVWTAVSLEMVPRLKDSCEMESGGSVSPDTIAGAQQGLEQLDPDRLGKAEELQLLQDAVEIIEDREEFIEDWLIVSSYVLDLFIAGLQAADETELAEQLGADSEASG